MPNELGAFLSAYSRFILMNACSNWGIGKAGTLGMHEPGAKEVGR
ncbi:hypothetical protein GA0061102_1005132 [Rhizobium miluonense]|uniref:Uncharacterized protein n=1 Tax=Rhizobium miluonense TaxID=411945 RepID=A0A1C3USI8_9HYPH|nr:hypothetical protein GA0061102_1005132 [Rhizobium miluonense]